MAQRNRFNLIEQPWIPVAGHGLVSIQQVFNNAALPSVSGSPIEKIALTKLLLAITQAACTPDDEHEWSQLKGDVLSKRVLQYLDQHYHCFWLYGETPFLQVPAVQAAAVQSFGALQAHISTGNTTVLTHSQIEREYTDAQRALLLLVSMGLALGGKKTDNTVVLSKGYLGKTKPTGKPTSGRPGPSLGFKGYLHNFLQADTLLETLWLNLLDQTQLSQLAQFSEGLGSAPWQQMPSGESDAVANTLRNSYMGRLVPLSRFCLLSEQGMHYCEGIDHPAHNDHMADISVAVNYDGKKAKAIWVNPEKRPWRELTAMLAFLSEGNNHGFNCFQLSLCLPRARQRVECLRIWSGGLSVSSNAGEQYASGADDFVESAFELPCELLDTFWYEGLRAQMSALDNLAKRVYSATLHYYQSQKKDGAKPAAMASHLFWQGCERHFQSLLYACVDLHKKNHLRRIFCSLAHSAFNHYCPRRTARQIDAWAQNRPNTLDYYTPNKNTNTQKQEVA